MKMRARSLSIVLALCVAAPVATAPSRAHAQISDADRNAARDLYVEGVALQKAGKYSEALDRFQRSLAVYPVAPTTAYHMAQCKEALGQLVEAAEQLRLVATTPLPQGASEAFNEAKADAAVELQNLEPRIPKLKVNVLPAGVQGLTVTIDGAQMPTALVGVPRPINPGSHRVVANAPGYAPSQQQVDVRERQQPTPEITLTLQPGGGGVTYQNVPPSTGGGYPSTGGPGQYPNTGGGTGGYPNYGTGGGGGYSPYGTWVPPRRRPEGPRNSLLIGIDGALNVPFGNALGNTGNPNAPTDLTNELGVGGSFGVDVGLRLARILYLGAVAQGSGFGGNSNVAGSPGGWAFGLDGILGLMSGPDTAGVYFEVGAGARVVSNTYRTVTDGELVLGIGAQVKAGSFRVIPKIDFFFDLGGEFRGFFTLGLAIFWELPLGKPAPQTQTDPNAPPADPNAAAPAPTY